MYPHSYGPGSSLRCPAPLVTGHNHCFPLTQTNVTFLKAVGRAVRALLELWLHLCQGTRQDQGLGWDTSMWPSLTVSTQHIPARLGPVLPGVALGMSCARSIAGRPRKPGAVNCLQPSVFTGTVIFFKTWLFHTILSGTLCCRAVA